MVEEADEAEYWLQILDRLQLGKQEERERLLREIDEIIRIVVTIKQRNRS